MTTEDHAERVIALLLASEPHFRALRDVGAIPALTALVDCLEAVAPSEFVTSLVEYLAGSLRELERGAWDTDRADERAEVFRSRVRVSEPDGVDLVRGMGGAHPEDLGGGGS